MRMSKNIALGVTLAGALALGACAKVELTPPHEAPLPTHARMLLGKMGMTEQQPIFIRIFKAESELEIWKQREDAIGPVNWAPSAARATSRRRKASTRSTSTS
jgi:murein L,D-transpeptidase YafK